MWSLFHMAFSKWEDPKTKREDWRLSVEGLMLAFRVVESPELMAFYRELSMLSLIRNRTRWMD